MSEERDREVGEAWRTANREEPPPALDAAIRAEARRAVGAGPEEARRRRLRQLRYPFAAAATVALLAFGIAQMLPPEEVVPGAVSDQPALRDRKQPSEEMASPAPSVALAPTPPPVDEVHRKQESSLRKESAERFTPSPPQNESATRAQTATAPSAAPAAKLAQTAPAPVQAAPATADSARSVAENAAKSEPFPAAPGVAQSVPADEPARASPLQPATPAANARRDTYAQAPQAQGSPATAVGQVRGRTAAANVSDFDELKAKDAGAESVAAWIARIRELKASGRSEAAAQELAKFRNTFGERADALLPPDLRATAPARP